MKSNEIEKLSFEIIEQEVKAHSFSHKEWQIVKRIIHTTADFEYLKTVKFQSDAIDAGISAILSGKTIITDTNMAKAGIRKNILEKFGVKVECFIDDSNVVETAAKEGVTRARAAVDASIPLIDSGIYVVGNAPTALLRLLELIKEKQIKPALIIGFPVGFVNAFESKKSLVETNFPFITNIGRKGGSNIAASVINALTLLAEEEFYNKNKGKSEKIGTLYGIGVGPGDPDLITLKATKILGMVDIIFAAASTKNDYSLAINIAKPHIPDNSVIMKLAFPMTFDKDETQKIWKKHAKTIIRELESGKNAAFLTLGDSMTYSTYGYILKNIQAMAPHIDIKTLPGISSYQAAAACLNIPLVEGEESLLIVSGANGGNKLRNISDKPENVVFLKAYKNIKDISASIDETNAFENCIGITNCGYPYQEVIEDIKDLNNRKPDYWTLIIAKKKKVIKK